MINLWQARRTFELFLDGWKCRNGSRMYFSGAPLWLIRLRVAEWHEPDCVVLGRLLREWEAKQTATRKECE